MRQLFVLILSILSLPSYCQVSSLVSENGKIECIYRLVYRLDSADQTSRSELMSLLIGNNISRFRSKIMLSNDSLLTESEGKPFNQANVQIFAGKLNKLPNTLFRYYIYKKLSNKTIDFYSKIGGKLYSYSEPQNIFVWKITSATATIAGYKCQKATTSFAGRIFEAWFTRDIPISDGPYKFCGLPGLIISVSDTKHYYSFDLIKLTELKTVVPIVVPIKNVVNTNKKDFRQGELVNEAGMLDRVAAMGNNITDADRQAFKERIKKRNNPIELK
ncbi:GLPGLI family protein [Hymenobacter sp. PAMC 26628]|uniref:GLPGLI family protein n=1 Tax=Hymenobacter sp. PAMC 26628 TaxID=1484118 RepID=UPI000902053C|nr:GLPGLI family protein [Hymenobacter sp. PAMC 26628]